MTKHRKRQLFFTTSAIGLGIAVLTVSILGSVLHMPVVAVLALVLLLAVPIFVGAFIGLKMFSKYPPRFAERAPPKRAGPNNGGPEGGNGSRTGMA